MIRDFAYYDIRCPRVDHDGGPIVNVCMQPFCSQKSLCCSECMKFVHGQHFDCLESLQQFQQKLTQMQSHTKEVSSWKKFLEQTKAFCQLYEHHEQLARTNWKYTLKIVEKMVDGLENTNFFLEGELTYSILEKCVIHLKRGKRLLSLLKNVTEICKKITKLRKRIQELQDEIRTMNKKKMEKLLRFQREEPDLYYRKAFYEFDKSNYFACQFYFSRLTQLHPRDEIAWFNLGYQCLCAGKTLMAIDAFNAATRIDSSCLEAFFWKGCALKHIKLYEEALPVFFRCKDLAMQSEEYEIWPETNYISRTYIGISKMVFILVLIHIKMGKYFEAFNKLLELCNIEYPQIYQEIRSNVLKFILEQVFLEDFDYLLNLLIKVFQKAQLTDEASRKIVKYLESRKVLRSVVEYFFHDEPYYQEAKMLYQKKKFHAALQQLSIAPEFEIVNYMNAQILENYWLKAKIYYKLNNLQECKKQLSMLLSFNNLYERASQKIHVLNIKLLIRLGELEVASSQLNLLLQRLAVKDSQQNSKLKRQLQILDCQLRYLQSKE